eukprot:5140983-Amphidinium_carterae.1
MEMMMTRTTMTTVMESTSINMLKCLDGGCDICKKKCFASQKPGENVVQLYSCAACGHAPLRTNAWLKAKTPRLSGIAHIVATNG